MVNPLNILINQGTISKAHYFNLQPRKREQRSLLHIRKTFPVDEFDDVAPSAATAIKSSSQGECNLKGDNVSRLKGGARFAGRPPQTNYEEIAKAIVKVRRTRTANMSSDIFWREVAKIVTWTSRKNENKMVKILKSIWSSNRGNIQNLVSGISVTMRKRNVKRRPKKLSNCWVRDTGRPRYCICNSHYDKEKQYMCCDLCQKWYHYTCMNIPPEITKGTNVKFHCGVGECNNGRYVLNYDKCTTKESKNEVCAEQTRSKKEPNKTRSEVLRTKPVSRKNNVKSKHKNGGQRKYTNVQDKEREKLSTRAKNISKPTVNILSGSNEPESNDVFFIKTVPRMASFVISKSEWCRLLERRKGRCLPSGEWQKYFLKELKRFNPYCVFMFKYHYLNLQGRSHRHFCTRGYCKFKDCKLIVEISMSSDCKCIVRMGGRVQHSKFESHSRPVRGADRRNARNVLGMGVKPMKLYMKRLASKQDHVIQSGNRDDCGNSLHVMQKISSEARSCDRDGKDELMSLISKMKSQRDKINSDGRVPGFIQQISVHPFYIICFTEAGIRVWHDLCKKDVVFWDATGGCVRRTGSKKPMFYYELSVRVGTTITRPRPIPKDARHVIDGPSNNNLEDKHRHENSSEPNTTCEETNTATVDLTIEDDVEDSSLGRVGSKTNEDVIDLTMKDEDTDATLRQDTSNNTLIRHYGVNIVPSDIDRLLNKKGWLNDNVINCYLNILSHKAMQVSNTLVYPFTTFFYTCFIRDGYNASSRLVKNTNIFENEIVLVPINYEFHWTLISINNKTKSVVFYDSLFSSNASFHLQSMKKYLMIELAKQHSVNKSLGIHDWSFQEAKNVSKQRNSSDCGVCVCLYSEFETGLRKSPSWNNIELERERIAAIIQSGVFESKVLP
ncbi:Sentrin-specific protease 2 [Holothuria leucospilota]|uniref:Sentrin-specific protease 2 n=1 Tax=Holothuria leucospilota TaxID=206669 RepID=A0A9Q0Y9Q2_HOLLE|nr:Sentrin-specific protease 2 [Holothuria leucospilota]